MRLASLRAAVVVGLAAAAFTAATAEAQRSRVAVLEWSGTGAARVRNQAVRGLSNAADLVPSDDVGAPSSEAEYASTAQEHGERAFVEGEVRRAGRRWRARVRVVDSTGAEIASESFQARSMNALGAQLRRRLWPSIREAVEASPDPGPGTAPTASVPPEPEAGGGPIAVLAFDGPGASRARDHVVDALSASGIEIVSSSRAEGVGEDLGTDDGRRDVARELGLAGLISGEVVRDGDDYEAQVRLYRGEDGELEREATFAGGSAAALLDDIDNNVLSELGDTIAELEPAGGGGGSDGGGGGSSSTPGGSSYRPPPTGAGAVPLTVFIELGLLNRSWSYRDDIFMRLRAYSLPVGPFVGIRAHWFPAAHFTDSFIGNFGFDVRAETAFGLRSTDSANREYPTTMYGVSLGARVRVPIGDHQITAVVGYASQEFRIDAIDPETPMPEVPDIDYDILRIGAEARVVFGPLAFELRGSYEVLAGTGPLSSSQWFTHVSGAGIEAGATVGFFLLDYLEIRAAVDYRRFFFSLNPEVGDSPNRIAGGALDEYWMGHLGAGVYFE
jgi:hypothetical protein